MIGSIDGLWSPYDYDSETDYEEETDIDTIAFFPSLLPFDRSHRDV